MSCFNVKYFFSLQFFSELTPFQLELKVQKELMQNSGSVPEESYCLLSSMNCIKPNASNETTTQNLSKYIIFF